jgi:N4-gp56 family major capsid protein
MTHQYKDPAGGTPSTIGNQMNTFKWDKRALIEARKNQVFGQLGSVTNLPKHMGKAIKKYVHVPLLDDANINDQGIDAAGATISNGNLYGSSKDIGSITSKLPTLTENGGRVNRVGYTRREIEGTIEKMGFFHEITQEAMDFDSEDDLHANMHREMVNGAMEIYEDVLQIELLAAAGVVKFAGGASIDSELDATCKVTYGDLLRLSIDLDNNRTPKQTKVITGTRLIDTATVAGGRIMYIGSELQPLFDGMVDNHGRPAFVPVHKYAAGTNVLNGEIGSVGYFRIIVVSEMLKWEGVGADATGDELHYATDDAFDVFPMLVVGDQAFSTIGFQTDGKNVKWKILTKMPGEATADRTDPYGESGFSSIKWWHGTLIERPERIALQKTVAIK